MTKRDGRQAQEKVGLQGKIHDRVFAERKEKEGGKMKRMAMNMYGS